MSDNTFRHDGIYRRRFQIHYPWGVSPSHWFRKPERGGDEWCNDSVIIYLGFLGAVVIFWRAKLRTMPCREEWDEIYDDELKADYAPCGYYWNGRLNKGGHQHWETGICPEARAWLKRREWLEQAGWLIEQDPEFIASRDAAEHARAEGRTTSLGEALAKLHEMDEENGT